MRMLIGCEHSGTVRNAMRAIGIDCWSCDLLPADDHSLYHIQADVRDVMSSKLWDAFGLHPDCTYLCISGLHWNERTRDGKWTNTHKALKFVRQIIELAGDRPYYIENPISLISTSIRKPDQIIQPYWFGDNASKKTCLWLNKLPTLYPTNMVTGRFVEWPKGSGVYVERWDNQLDSGQNKESPSEDRWKTRSKTYPGIAKALADQLGQSLLWLEDL
jgi:hypothetical protein